MHALALFGRGRPAGWALLAAATVFVGYINLWFGGTDVASVLLTVGYLAVIPIAILARRDGIGAQSSVSVSHDSRRSAARPASDDSRSVSADIAAAPPYGVAAIVSGVVLTLYIASLAPTTAMWDASEYIASARVLGIPHPPGNPVFVFLAHAFGLLPLPISYAARINLLAAVTSALSAGFWFLVADRTMQSWLQSRRTRHIAAAAAAWIGATAFTVWNQSVVNEKVYTVALLGVAAVSWLAIRWLDERTTSRGGQYLLLATYLCGVGYANHPAGLLPLPALGVLILMRQPGLLMRWRLGIAAAATMLLGLTPFAFQPIRSANTPAINGGAPTACRSGPQLGCTFSAETLSRLMANINREQYGGHKVAERQAPFDAQLQMWWMYFERQWLRDAYSEHAELQRALALLFLALGVGGAVVHWQRDRSTFWYVAPLIITLNLVLVFYLNFKLAPSQDIALGNSVAREVRDRDYFYLWGFSTWGIWAGTGVAALWDAVRNATLKLLSSIGGGGRAITAQRRETFALLAAAPVFALAFVPFVGNIEQAPRRGQTFTREWAIDLLNSVEPYSILVTYGDNDSFPLWYAQEVEGVRRDVTLALAPYLGSDWYVRELLTRKPDAYDATRGPAIYRDGQWTRPVTSPLAMTSGEADAIPQVLEIKSPQRFVHGDISAIIQPGYITRDQFVVLRFIKDAFPARPIYFSIGNYAQALGLAPYILQQGLAQRLMPTPIVGSATVIPYPGGFLDITRTNDLWWTYGGPGALIKQNSWIDEPSNGIPTMYAMNGQLLAAGLAARGDSVGAQKVMQTVNSMVQAARIGN